MRIRDNPFSASACDMSWQVLPAGIVVLHVEKATMSVPKKRRMISAIAAPSSAWPET
jgi:hypothetical protein